MSADAAALRVVAERVAARLRTRVAPAVLRCGPALWRVMRAEPTLSATELLSHVVVHQALTGTLDATSAQAQAVIAAGYQAGAQLGRVAAAAELKSLGHVAARRLPPAGGHRDAVLADVRAVFAEALLDLHNTIRVGYDGISGPGASPARVLATQAGLRRVAARLAARVQAAGAVAVHRAYTDAQLAVYGRYAEVNPFVRLGKRWQTGGSDPCPACAALDGAVVALSAEFDHTASTQPQIRVAVYRDLAGPPRHPHCRCRLVLDVASPR